MADLDLTSHLGRNSRSYDALPYVSEPFPTTHPALLGAIARLFATETAPLGGARILELGCAVGGNIIPLAAHHPDATVVGIDLSGAQIAAAQARISDLKLTNIEVRCQSIDDLLDVADAPFDYIICHGVYSWVPASVREAILRICRQRLSARGVAIVSYNVLPGWRLQQALRDSFLLHVPPDDDPHRRVAAARALLQALPQACSDTGLYKALLTEQAERLARYPDAYIAHELLEDVNEPCTFRDFIAAAGRHGLAFLAEADVSTMIPSMFAPATAALVQTFGRNEVPSTEQYIDIVSGRTFRQTLLVASERAARIDRNPSGERLQALHFLGRANFTLTRDAGGTTLAEPNGRRLQVSSAALADVLAYFVARFPGSSSFDDLVAALPAAARNAEGRALIRELLLKAVTYGMATPRTEPVPAVARAGPRPIASPLARVDAARGALSTVNLRHERVDFDDFTRFALPLLDGSRDAAALRAAIADGARHGRITFDRDGVPVRDVAAQGRIAGEKVDALLPMLARAALLQA
jgi:methyltransferase-like protein/trans-aconitate methyltransferase